jgi:hypothetical protein
LVKFRGYFSLAYLLHSDCNDADRLVELIFAWGNEANKDKASAINYRSEDALSVLREIAL